MPAKVKIDEEQLLKLAQRGWPAKAIAHFFNCHEDTITRRFAAKIELAKARGGATALDMAWRKADKGSERMIELLVDRLLGKLPNKIELTDEIVDSYISQKQAADADSKGVPGKEKE